jgi:hypothetical protein
MFQRARPELMQAARWALYAERAVPVLVPMLKEFERVQASPLPKDAHEKAKAMPVRLAARDGIDLIRSVLFPDG